MHSFVNGLLLSSTLIIAIGAQNLHVLRHGLMKNHVFVVALTCFICDFLLMSLGVFGVGEIIQHSPRFMSLLMVLAIAFLLYYGYGALKKAIKGEYLLIEQQTSTPPPNTLSQAILATLAITLLNPHVYLDTVVLIGGVSASLNFSAKSFFVGGALLASFTWFFSLAYASRWLVPLFKRPLTWRIFDLFVALFMCFLAVGMLQQWLK